MAELTYFTKDPDAVLDYPWQWHLWLEGDTIESHEVTAETGLTVETSSVVDVTASGTTYTDAGVIAWLSGGTAGVTYAVTCRIDTAAGRTDERTSKIRVRER